jgi:hypothetical protein
MRMLTGLLLAATPVYAQACYAQACAPTPEAAAIGIVGGTSTAQATTGVSGYRVQDVQTDAAMHRVWVRVSRCGDASAPLILVPLRATLAGGAQSPQSALLTSSAASPNTAVLLPEAQAMAIHWGDAVKAVFASSNVQMELDATANGQAAIGGIVEITLARRGDEPAHRMHGVLRAPGRVEVQP